MIGVLRNGIEWTFTFDKNAGIWNLKSRGMKMCSEFFVSCFILWLKICHVRTALYVEKKVCLSKNALIKKGAEA